jgi:hypothetical protein
MLSELPQKYVCNNCATTKAGEECKDCDGHGCTCSCNVEPSDEGVAEYERRIQLDDDIASMDYVCEQRMMEVGVCTRPKPHICQQNGPCNGWPKPGTGGDGDYQGLCPRCGKTIWELSGDPYAHVGCSK